MYKKAFNAFQKILDLAKDVKDYLKNNFLKTHFTTEFDSFRVKQINSQFQLIVDLLKLGFALITKFKSPQSNKNFIYYIDLIIKNCLVNIKKCSKEPLSYFPDLSIYLLSGDDPVGQCVIKSKDIIWSDDESTMGCICAKMVYMEIKVLEYFYFNQKIFVFT